MPRRILIGIASLIGLIFVLWFITSRIQWWRALGFNQKKETLVERISIKCLDLGRLWGRLVFESNLLCGKGTVLYCS
jgi:hypothetical protein